MAQHVFPSFLVLEEVLDAALSQKPPQLIIGNFLKPGSQHFAVYIAGVYDRHVRNLGANPLSTGSMPSTVCGGYLELCAALDIHCSGYVVRSLCKL